MDLDYCKGCKNEDIVIAGGNPKSPILLIGESPEKEDIKRGTPMNGAAGAVLRIEMAKVKLDFKTMRRVNLWLHTPNRREECQSSGLEYVIAEAKNRRAILLLGSETVKFFTGYNVSDVNGLQVPSDYLSAPYIIACLAPKIVFHSTVGEFRFALQEFSKIIKEKRIIK